MSHHQRPGASGWLAAVAALCAAVTSPLPCQADGFIETFDDDPVAAGRFLLHDEPGDASRFLHDGGTLTAKYDTSLPTARLVRPLGHTLTHNDSFSYRAVFIIKSDGFEAHDEFIGQIAFGLMNATTTGPGRVRGLGGGAFDLVSFDYFPNITEYGGPSLGTTIINSDTGSFAGAINFEFGAETEMNNAGESELPFDTPLTAEITYNGDTGQAIVRVIQGAAALPINAVGKYFLPGGLDGDATTIVTTLDGVGFVVDTFALALWHDPTAPFPDEPALIADVVFDSLRACWPSFGDFDGDCDVDQDDFGVFQACASGPAVPLAPGCEGFDVDGDDDVDQADFGQFQVMITGPR